ncbi:hypothetical protein Tco_1189064 [Tanacetum coccineum]
MAMTIQYGVRGMIPTTQSEAFKQENVPLVESEMDEAHASRYLVHPGADKKYYNLGDMYGYIKNHKKTVKNGQARTRESKEYKKKPKNQSRSQKVKDRGQIQVIKVKSRDSLALSHSKATSSMEEAQRGVGFALNSLTQQAQRLKEVERDSRG